MYNFSYLVTYLYIISIIQFVNSYKEGDILTKKEVLNITNEYYISFYCKNDICVLVHNEYFDRVIEIPNENGTMIKYITYTCSYDNIISGKCSDKTCDDYGNYTYNTCKNDSECLSNKCFNNFCMFNEENPIDHCDDVYIKPFYI
ncbi:hypothetical protein BCR36DRAFT_412123 [Piromyces finnis]|uniref:Uncharacterized protein n=1 Tax=Piromyces finnis TaxID=1754191 RepID=A0A1Y1U614_9FUNG|nr:hypothetical protein BCR36DRAFT_417271 [Piromyces finnis]ORX50622.1 hypothetical protein BCR36DRAFT_412123 [Piromyces finnis]|eukprot:ORX33469.1 hypothetical protein BCR36DRAFT_417271 [Piromyces finnis]